MTQNETAAPTTSTRKERRKEIVARLIGALSDYKQELGEKKLATHVKKVSKLIVRDLEKNGKKQHTEKEKAVGKKLKSVKKEKPAKKASKKASKKSEVKK